jgi:hypothetical protein
MPFKRHLLTAVAFALCASLGRAAVPSKHEVLQAIAVMEKSISGPQAVEAAKTIVVYAQSSDDVLVNIGPDELPWLDEDWRCSWPPLSRANVKSQIKNEKAEDDTYSGWLFAIDTYTRLRAKEGFTSPSMDSLAKMRADGTLLQHARDVRSKEEQEEQADEQKKPMA